MAGIYIHIPFCRTKCGYCNFFSVASLKHASEVLSALLAEIDLTEEYLQKETIETLYFGGGTPSLLQPASIQSLLDAINAKHRVAADAEITLEANPDDLSAHNLKAWIDAGINRISMGIQSFQPSDLAFLDRRHNAEAARQSLRLLASAPLHSWSADLIYNIPGQTVEMLEHNLRLCIEAGTPHISCYALTVEEKTLLHRQIRSGEKPLPPETDFREHFLLVANRLSEAGYLHYETSNFALPGHLARHNTGYWFQKPYLGLGPSAHSYNGTSRRWNPASISAYLAAVAKGQPWEEEERLSSVVKNNEFIMTRLRTCWGIPFEEIKTAFGPQRLSSLLRAAEPWIASGHMKTDGNCLWLTFEGMLFTDRITSSLFAEK